MGSIPELADYACEFGVAQHAFQCNAMLKELARYILTNFEDVTNCNKAIKGLAEKTTT